MKNVIGFLTATMLIATTACAGSNLPDLPAQQNAPYRLGAGDELRVTVFGLDSVNNTYRVSDTGSIAVPLVDSVSVAGKSIDEAQVAIAEALRSRQIVLDPRVSVQMQTYRPFFILGEVQRPGQYPYVPGMSVTTAVSIAGGYTFRANTKRARITRDARPANAGADSAVQPGDTITIPESWF